MNPSDQLSFEESFKSCSASHRSTVGAMQSADSRRVEIKKLMADGKLSHAALSEALKEYM